MKKLFSLIALAILTTALQAAYVPVVNPTEKSLNANEVFIPLGGTDKKISLMELSSISSEELESRTGRKMGFGDRIAFRKAQRKLKKAIAADGTISSKKIVKHVSMIDGETGFHLGGFALGFLVGLIGVLIAYLINDDKKSNRTKWAWIGFGIGLVITIILIASAL
ncbi:MAG: hypothetical protein MUF24_13425 [Chitinophagaceae bacterium]|jgi:hypothetical protein|nr:hypothetical protein [Chitinophagaceae bacterium]